MRLAVLILATGCAAADSGDSAAPLSFDYPLDDVLRWNHVQALGTHNSYHQHPPSDVVYDWDYEHLPLDQQLDLGVRQFELDAHWDAATGEIAVYHVIAVDAETSCATWLDCIGVLRAWMDRQPAALPILVLVEAKAEGGGDDFDAAALVALDGQLREAWPSVITPGEVRGEAATLREAIADVGWPTLRSLRGRAAFMLHEYGALRDAYLAAVPDPALFPQPTTVEDAWASAFVMNDPVGDAGAIAEAASHGYLVRTMADPSEEEADAKDYSARDAALAGAAHFVSTNWPAVTTSDDPYAVGMDRGTPARCHAATAPVECTAEDLEDPAFLR
jgi:hypothetical protein